jgi:hypothetical protein
VLKRAKNSLNAINVITDYIFDPMEKILVIID